MTIYCIGRNYALHAKELGNEIPEEPVIFLKANTSLRNFNEGSLAFENEDFHFEGEIVLHISSDHSLNEKYHENSFNSFSFGIDLTRRETQTKLKNKGLPWTTSKSFLGSAIIGQERSKELLSENFKFEFYLNENLRQSGELQNLLFSFKQIINYINTFSPLKRGDLVFTGTPEGVGVIKKGDSFSFKSSTQIFESGTL